MVVWWAAFAVGAWIAPLKGQVMGQGEVGGGQREDQVVEEVEGGQAEERSTPLPSDRWWEQEGTWSD